MGVPDRFPHGRGLTGPARADIAEPRNWRIPPRRRRTASRRRRACWTPGSPPNTDRRSGWRGSPRRRSLRPDTKPGSDGKSWKEIGAPGVATAAAGVLPQQPGHWLLMSVVVRAADTSHLLTIKGAVELCDRPRAVSVCWGHERLVGCWASSPAIRELRVLARLATKATTPTKNGGSRA